MARCFRRHALQDLNGSWKKGSKEFIREAVKEGVVISLGHSSATFEEAVEGVEAGATMFTHTFNGMPDPSHHIPSISNAAMALNNVTDELICDGHHVQPSMAKTLINAVGPEHIALITDCMEAGMMPDGDYMLGELPVYVKDGMARLKDGDNLAGSILQLKQAIKECRWLEHCNSRRSSNDGQLRSS